MGICYEVFIFDEFDWNYANTSKDVVKKQIVDICPHAELKADLYGLLIFDIDKFSPRNFVSKITMDALKYRQDDKLLQIFDIDLHEETNHESNE